MAAASIPTTSGIETNSVPNKQDENARNPTVEELLIQIENHLYKSIEHRASLLIAVWSCLAGKIGCFRNMEKVFHMLYRESAMTIFCGHWPKVNLLFKRGLSRALIHFSHSMGHYIKGAEGLCSALVMATYDPWGDSVIHKLLSKEDIDQNLVDDFIKSEPFELLVIRVECLVNARFEEAAIRLCRCCLRSHLFHRNCEEEDDSFKENWRWTFMEWLLRLLFRKGRLNDLVAESGACSCHDGVRLIYRTRCSPLDDSEPLTETLINLFLVRDLLFQSNYCCTSELMSLWCDFQVQKQRSVPEIQDAAHKLLVGHASSSAQFYLFVDILWGKFGASLLPLYIEMYVRGLTSDLNYLEAARQADNKEYIIEIENHMAAMYFKLSSMFNTINKEISLECMLSSFSLNPTKERLDWIKKLSLQISKEKALKVAASKNESCKHKLCNKTGCAYVYPVTAKKKSVVMCDQAIQVGDESFENEGDLQIPLNCNINDIEQIDESTITTPVQNENITHLKQHNEKMCDISNKENELSQKEHVEKNCHSNSCEKDTNSTVNIADSNSDKPLNLTTVNKHVESNLSSVHPTAERNEINYSNEKDCHNADIIDYEKHCCSDTKKNFVPHNGEICEESGTGEELEKVDVNCKNSKIDNDHKTNNLNSDDKKLEHTSSKTHKSNRHKESFKETNAGNHEVNENGFISHPESENSMASVSLSKKKSKHVEQNSLNIGNNIDKQSNDVCVNGCGEIKNTGDSEETNIIQPNKEHKSDDLNKDIKASIVCKNTLEIPIDSNSLDTMIKEKVCENAGNKNSEIMSTSLINSENSVKDECKHDDTSEGNKISLSSVVETDFQNLPPFSHIVLDSKIGGLSEDLLSDFVIVLESLRNKQLKSSCKWSQIKHLCEDYLENVTNSRCMMLNMQLNGSVDSEADSMSEFTAAGFNGFQSHQSDDSVVEDQTVDKNHVFKRFMHADKNAEMATYVNLSDIHCPQIPLEKLFYTEHSSSHLVHKKRHKKHRNHDKNPEKVVLRKLRYSSRAEHDLIKRKKRKKRKGKRTKGHVKKHHFTHGKVNKNCLKNKKKKHKLKKKKEERNSGFISGDYCSDFSSAELMRLVKEHSHSYTKLPATTSKHPHSAASSSDEPIRKKRKVSFDKKKQKGGKYHDKHKHEKSKSSKRKKKLAIESCPNTVKNITDHTLHGKLDAVNDYSRIVQYSSVKKMEAVQIRQRSVALNLAEVSKVHQEQENRNALVNPCASNSQIQQLVQQNFESSEDIMKMQLLMAQQQPDVLPISSNSKDFLPSANNQAVLKYVCSKMTSHLLSVAQSSNCIPSDSEGSKSSIPTHSGRPFQAQNSKIQPQNLTSNLKHVIIERGGVPYKLSSSSSSLAGTIIPVSSLPSSVTSDSRSLMGAVFSGGITYPATVTSPQMTTFTIPVAHNAPGSKLVTSKIVIPINQCSNIRSATPTSVSLPEPDCRTLASTSNNPPISGVIIVKNGNNTQIISGVQPPSSVLPCLSGTRVALPLNRNRPSPIVSKTVPKIIKQAAKKLSQPVLKKPVIKTICAKPQPNTSSISEISNDPVIAANLLACKEPEINKTEIYSTSKSSLPKDETSNTPIPIKDSSLPEESSETPKENPSPVVEPIIASLQKENTIQSIDQKESNTVKNSEDLPTSVPASPKPASSSSSVKDVLLSDAHVFPKLPSVPGSPKDNKPVNSPNVEPEEMNTDKNSCELAHESPCKEEDKQKEETSIVPESSEVISSSNKVCEEPPETVSIAKVSSPVHEDEKENDASSVPPEQPETPKDDNENTISSHVSISVEENKPLPQTDEDNDVSLKVLSTERTNHSSIKAVNLNSSDQEKQLQPINDAEISSDKSSPKASSQNKSEGGNQTSEAPTRSFTSISDAVRFSLMDMDDATDSVENQVVLQAFQTSHASSPSSPAYAASESGEERNSASPSSAVMLSAPQSTSTTELNVSRVSQRFEPSVHCSQSEKFPECQNTVSRTTSWILEDTITEASPAVTVQKSPDIDSCGEGKDDDKPKKKRKKKERVDNDVTHKFWCQICSKGFFSAYNLRRHCRNVHKMLVPRGSSDVPFTNSSQCLPHVQQADTTTSETSSSRLSYGNVQTSCVSPNKGSEYSLLSPTHDGKNQEFPVKSGQHVPQIQQSTEFQMQTTPRMTSQSSSTHISPVTPPKDFRLGTPTSVPASQISQTKMSPVKSSSQSKFQRLPTSSQVPQQMAKISQMQQIALCGQQALQQQRQMGQLQSSGLIQPLPSVACQAQQMQASQCPHFQANKQIVQQRIGQLQLMHHVAQLPSVPHAAHGIQKPAQSQSFKKCSTNQPTSKISENEQVQQAAQLAQNQQLLANQQMQKLIQIRQNAIAASGIASQLSLANAIPSVSGSPAKGATQCFQSQLAAARQAAVVGQIPTAQRAQGTSYNMPSHDTSSHQFFSPAVQPSQDQASCPHSSFSAQNMSEFSSNTPSYPTIRLSSEANDGLEDLEQFLLENMPWSGEQSSAHGLAQQSGNRPSSADSLTLSIPSQTSSTSQNRGGVASKSKASISRPKPRKPVATPCSKNLLGNLGRGVKKKSCSKKTSKSSDTECSVSKPEVFPQANLVQQSHEIKHCNKDAIGNIPNFPKQTVKNSSVGILNETDSSDSVQCINVTHNAPKNTSVGINFNIFSPVGLCTSEKTTDLMCNPSSCKEAYDGQRKNSFLDHSNLVGTSSSNLDQNKSTINMNQCETTNPINMGSAFNPTGKSSATTMKPFCPTAATSPYGITNETPNPQDIFLGQRNSETSDSNNSDQKLQKSESNSCSVDANTTVNANNSHNSQVSEMLTEKSQLDKNLFLGGNTQNSDVKLGAPVKKEETESNLTSEVVPSSDICNSEMNCGNSESKDITPSKFEEILSSKIDEKTSTKETFLTDTNSHSDGLELKDNNSHFEELELKENKSNSEELELKDDNSHSEELGLKDNVSHSEELELKDNNFQSDNLDMNKSKDEHESNIRKCDKHDENFNTTVMKDDCKENQTLSSTGDHSESDIKSEPSNTVSKNSTEDNFIPKVVDHDEHSIHEDTIPNDENHLPKKTDLENIPNEMGLNRIALRIRKPQDTSNKRIENDKTVQFFVTDKEDIKNQVIKKSSKKKKVKQENRKNENIISDTKISFKLDNDSKIQKTSLLNNVKEKEINRSLCMITSCYDGIKKNNSIESESHDDGFCLDEKQLEEASVDGIPAARLRLRDTPKTSVKRVCPCCADSKMPKKCRANGGGNITKIIGTKVSNSLKTKSTLKTRNTTNGHNGKVNTRSSQRLRSRNNAIS